MFTIRRFLSTSRVEKNLGETIKKNWSKKKKQDFDSFINNEKNRKLVELLRQNWKKEAMKKIAAVGN